MTDSLLDRFDCDSAQLTRHLGDILIGADDGELFVENIESESLMFDDGKLKSDGVVAALPRRHRNVP